MELHAPQSHPRRHRYTPTTSRGAAPASESENDSALSDGDRRAAGRRLSSVPRHRGGAGDATPGDRLEAALRRKSLAPDSSPDAPARALFGETVPRDADATPGDRLEAALRRKSLAPDPRKSLRALAAEKPAYVTAPRRKSVVESSADAAERRLAAEVPTTHDEKPRRAGRNVRKRPPRRIDGGGPPPAARSQERRSRADMSDANPGAGRRRAPGGPSPSPEPQTRGPEQLVILDDGTIGRGDRAAARADAPLGVAGRAANLEPRKPRRPREAHDPDRDAATAAAARGRARREEDREARARRVQPTSREHMTNPHGHRAPAAPASSLPRDPRALRYVLGASDADEPAADGVEGRGVSLERRARGAVDSGRRARRRRDV